MAVAVPNYVGTNIREAPPGHRFRLYFDAWTEQWLLPKDGRDAALDRLAEVPRHSSALLAAIRKRQDDEAEALGDEVLCIDAKAGAPFLTGVGMEHPMENGFAFLDPYGLPYLPGSSVKGVLRRAAEELALFETESRGWTMAAVWWLFGFDAESAHVRRAPREEAALSGDERRYWQEAYKARIRGREAELLAPLLAGCPDERLRRQWRADERAFLEQLPESGAIRDIHLAGAIELWDAFPEPTRGSLRVDVMNPHFSKYHQRGDAPSDNDDPKPIFFLALPAGSSFCFHARLVPSGGLPSSLRGEWRALLEAAFDYALEWLGFGAKTSVGYGRMRRDERAESREEQRRRADQDRRRRDDEARATRQQAEREADLAALGPLARWVRELQDPNTAQQRVDAIFKEWDALTSDDDKRQVAPALKAAYERLDKWGKRVSEKQTRKNAGIQRYLEKS
jgi:CRISPR-associated protein Cmr6